MKSAIEISESLKAVSSFLNLQQNQQLISDINFVCKQLVDPSLRIAVLAPFNFGKSTLLNALLGREIMPTKIIRTTGTAIKIKYGKELATRVILKTGEVINSSNLDETLKEFAVLESKRKTTN